VLSVKKFSLKPVHIGILCFVVTVQALLFTFLFRDRTPPVVKTLQKTVSYNSTIAVNEIATGTDNRSNVVSLSIEGVSPNTAVISEDSSSVFFSDVGTYTVSILGADKNNNQTEATTTITVVDETPPEFTAVSDTTEVGYNSTVTISSDSSAKDAIYAKATDEITNVTMLISSITPRSKGLSADSYTLDSGTAQFHALGSYDVVLSAQDDYGNEATHTVTVTAVDRTAPVLKGLKSSVVLAETDSDYDFLEGISATDEIDGDLTQQISLDAVNVSYGVVGDYTVSYTVSDNAGNVETQNTHVTIKDTTPPTLVLANSSFSLTAGDAAPDYASGISASDTLDGDLTSSITIDDSEVDYDTPGTYEVTYRIADNSGNATTQHASVTVNSKSTYRSSSDSGSSTYSSGSETVLITRTGSCYHTHKCGNGTYFEVSLSTALSKGLRPCKKCY
jgi:hypothetical protein